MEPSRYPGLLKTKCCLKYPLCFVAEKSLSGRSNSDCPSHLLFESKDASCPANRKCANIGRLQVIILSMLLSQKYFLLTLRTCLLSQGISVSNTVLFSLLDRLLKEIRPALRIWQLTTNTKDRGPRFWIQVLFSPCLNVHRTNLAETGTD